jgi:hypothetical protein
MKRISSLIIPILAMHKSRIKNPSGVITSRPDYLQNIIGNKSQFTGRPFSAFMESLRVAIRYFYPYAGMPYNGGKETSTLFAFYFPENATQLEMIYPCLEVCWEPFLNASHSLDLYNNTGGKWSQNASSFYEKGTISDILVIE